MNDGLKGVLCMVFGTFLLTTHDAISKWMTASFTVGEVMIYRSLVPARLVGHTVHAGAWVDVGTPHAYLAANLAVLDGAVNTPIDPWTRGSRGSDGSWIGEDAEVQGSVHHSIIGHGAHVPAGVTLRDCVVWDGVTVPEGDYTRAVIYDDGQVLSL